MYTHLSRPARSRGGPPPAPREVLALSEARDIFDETASIDIAQGLPRLAIPRNYFDDLEARWGLEPDLIEAMAARDILYDRDGEAEYLQFYSRAFARRVFFEVVERRGYAGYGAVNAPIRLAAQARHKPDFPD